MDAVTTDLLHPDDPQYIWLPIAVLVVILLLAALVYAMSRSRRLYFCACCRPKNAQRNGYISVEDEDSDVSMACGEDYGERIGTACLLQGRLHIENITENFQTTQVTDATNDESSVAAVRT